MGGDYTYTYIKCIFIPQNAYVSLCMYCMYAYASHGPGVAPRLLRVLEQNGTKSRDMEETDMMETASSNQK